MHRPLRATRRRRARGIALADHRVLLRVARSRAHPGRGDLRLAGRLRRRSKGGGRRRVSICDRPRNGGRRSRARPHPARRTAPRSSRCRRGAGRRRRRDRHGRSRSCRIATWRRCRAGRHSIRGHTRVACASRLHRRLGRRQLRRLGADRGVRDRLARRAAPRAALVNRCSSRLTRRRRRAVGHAGRQTGADAPVRRQLPHSRHDGRHQRDGAVRRRVGRRRRQGDVGCRGRRRS